jgi:transcriptional regulator with XRE-family HTH domain
MRRHNTTARDGTINRILRLLRVAEDITARELAGKLGLSASYISEIETGKKEPTLKVLNAYGAFFGISPANLLYIQEESPSASNAELMVGIFERKVESERDRARIRKPSHGEAASALASPDRHPQSRQPRTGTSAKLGTSSRRKRAQERQASCSTPLYR